MPWTGILNLNREQLPDARSYSPVHYVSDKTDLDCIHFSSDAQSSENQWNNDNDEKAPDNVGICAKTKSLL